MTVIFKISQNYIFTLKTVEEKTGRRYIKESFELLSFFEDLGEKGAALCLCQRLQGLELMVGFQMNLKSLESQWLLRFFVWLVLFFITSQVG